MKHERSRAFVVVEHLLDALGCCILKNEINNSLKQNLVTCFNVTWTHCHTFHCCNFSALQYHSHANKAKQCSIESVVLHKF